MHRLMALVLSVLGALATDARGAERAHQDANQIFLKNMEAAGESSQPVLSNSKRVRKGATALAGPATIALETGAHTAPPQDLLFTPDGKFVVSAGADKAVRFWDWPTGRPSRVVREKSGPDKVGAINAVAISPDGKLLVTGGYFAEFTGKNYEEVGVVRVRELSSGRIIKELRGNTNVITSIAFSPDGNTLAAAAKTSWSLWRLSRGASPTFEQVSKYETPKTINELAFAGDGNRIIIAYNSGEVQFWPISGSAPTDTLSNAGTLQGTPSPALIAVSPTTGDIAIGGEYDDRVIVRNAQLVVTKELELPSPFNNKLSFSADGKTLAVAGVQSKCALSWDSETWVRSEYCATGVDVDRVAMHPNREGIATASGMDTGYSVDVWDRATDGRMVLKAVRAATAKPVFNVAFSADGNRLLWGGPFKSPIKNTDEAKELRGSPTRFEVGLDLPRNQMGFGRPESVENKISSTGCQGPRLTSGNMAVRSRGDSIEISNVGQEKATVTGEHSLIELSADGQTLFVADRDIVRSYPTGALVAASGKRLVDVAKADLGPVFTGHEGLVLALAASADGRLLATASVDKTIKLWNARTGELLVTIFAPSIETWVIFTPRGYFASSQSGAQFLQQISVDGAAADQSWRNARHKESVVADTLNRLSAAEAEAREKGGRSLQLKPFATTPSEEQDRKVDEGNALIELAISQSQFDGGSLTDKSIQRVLQAIQLKTSAGQPPVERARDYFVLGTFYGKKSDWENAFKALEEAVALADGHTARHAIIRQSALNNMAQYEKLRARPLAALAYTKRAAAVFADQKESLPAVIDIAGKFLNTGDNAEAEAYARVAISLLGDDGVANDLMRAKAHALLARVFARRQMPEDSRDQTQRAIVFAKQASLSSASDPKVRSEAVELLSALNFSLGDAEGAQNAAEELLALESASGSNLGLRAKAEQMLGNIDLAQKRPFAAEAHLKRSMQYWGSAFGLAAQYMPQVASVLEDMGHTKRALGDSLEAQKFFNTALDIQMKNGSPWSDVSHHLQMTGLNAFALGDWKRATDYLAMSEGLELRTSAGDDLDDPEFHRGAGDEVVSLWLKALWQQYSQKPTSSDELVELSYRVSQREVGTRASKAILQMVARLTEGNTDYRDLARSRQEIVAKLRAIQVALLTSREPALVAGEATAAAELAKVETALAETYPKAETERPGAHLSIAETQALLHEDEALVVVVPTRGTKTLPEETFIWVVSKSDARWIRSDMGADQIARAVATLRCGLDETNWDVPTDQVSDSEADKQVKAAQRRKAQACHKELKREPQRDADGNVLTGTLPFDHALAFRAYKSLFGEAEDLIKGKSLLFVPAGALTTLPLQVLITVRPPENPDDRKIAWLAKAHPLAVLPAVSSLKALRRSGTGSAAIKPYIGFGNPLLSGDPSDATDVHRSDEARAYDNCANAGSSRTAPLRAAWAITPLRQIDGLVDQAHLRKQAPLPETAEELCDVAKELKADIADVHLAQHATERQIKALSQHNTLAKFRILHFATHGTLAGQLRGSTEPGLILTPPAKSTEEDDGYLSASEIAGLKLDADIVILSACNTAGGAGPNENAEAMSGLARAFFYAQARSLIVSHWAVDSNATVALITGTVRKLGPSTGLSGAMQLAIIDMIDHGQSEFAHPAFWAPFVVVGEMGPPAR